MYPNPQEAFPLPPRPNIEHFKKDAKLLVQACQSNEISAWTRQWVERLARGQGRGTRAWMLRQVEQLSAFAQQRLSRRCSPAGAQFVIARALGFVSWPKFTKHLEEVRRSASPISKFEMAADAIVSGDARTLRRLLREDPKLIRARSTREHRATLLHYVSANGVEGYRQKSPANAVEIASMLLDAGAAIDAGANVYEANCSTLGLVATSAPPHAAGVQIPLIRLLLERGARLDRAGSAGRRHSHVFACLANGQPDAARFLAENGAPIDFVAAAGLGRLEIVQKLTTKAKPKQKSEAFIWACAYGRNDVIEFLLDNGVDIGSRDKNDQTGLHWAVMIQRLESVKLLLRRGAPLDVRNVYGGTPLGQARWSANNSGDPERFAPVIETLLAAGAKS